jgi:hypothetical protein
MAPFHAVATIRLAARSTLVRQLAGGPAACPCLRRTGAIGGAVLCFAIRLPGTHFSLNAPSPPGAQHD